MPINPVLAHAVQVLHELPGEFQLAGQKLATANLGPYVIDVSCRTGFLGIYGHHWTTTVDFSGARAQLQQVLDQASARSKDFDVFNQQLTGWFRGPLQVVSKVMDELRAASRELIKTDPSKLTVFRLVLCSKMKEVVDLLDSSRQQLNAIDLRLGQLLQALDDYNRVLTQIQANLQEGFDDASRSLSDYWIDKPCGSGDGLGQLDNWKAVFKTATDLIAANLGSLRAYTHQADAGLAQIVGVVTNSLAEFQPVLGQLSLAADAELSKYMESLHLDVAYDLWSSLATTAGTLEDLFAMLDVGASSPWKSTN